MDRTSLISQIALCRVQTSNILPSLLNNKTILNSNSWVKEINQDKQQLLLKITIKASGKSKQVRLMLKTYKDPQQQLAIPNHKRPQQ